MAHEDIMRAIGRLEGKVDEINSRLDTLNGSQKKQDDKIDSLESWKDQLTGKIAIISVFVAGAVSLFFAFIRNKLGL